MKDNQNSNIEHNIRMSIMSSLTRNYSLDTSI